MCHVFLNDSRFFQFLFQIDQAIAAEVQATGCSCGGVLHSARYPRKPRGMGRVVDQTYETRLSFCCAKEGCRRRCTPSSVRFLGRKVYLGFIVVLVTAMEHGLNRARRQALIDELDIAAQSLSRWRRWWREFFPTTRCWHGEAGYFVPPIKVSELPGAWLGRLQGEQLHHRLCHLLWLLAPVTSCSCTRYLTVVLDPQNM